MVEAQIKSNQRVFSWKILKTGNVPLYKSNMFPDETKCGKFRIPKRAYVDRSSLSVGVACSAR